MVLFSYLSLNFITLTSNHIFLSSCIYFFLRHRFIRCWVQFIVKVKFRIPFMPRKTWINSWIAPNTERLLVELSTLTATKSFVGLNSIVELLPEPRVPSGLNIEASELS